MKFFVAFLLVLAGCTTEAQLVKLGPEQHYVCDKAELAKALEASCQAQP